MHRRSISAIVSAIKAGECALKYYKDKEHLILIDFNSKSERELYEYNPLKQTDEEDPLLDMIYSASQRISNTALMTAHDLINIEGADFFHMFFHSKDVWYCSFMTDSGALCHTSHLTAQRAIVEKRN